MANTVHWADWNDVRITSIPNVTILDIDPDSTRRQVNILPLARTDKRKTESSYYIERTVTLRVCITQFSREHAERTRDQLLEMIQGNEGELTIPQGVGARRYTATLGTPAYLHRGGSYIEMQLPFMCSDSFAYENDYTVLVNLTGKTDASRSDAISVSGSAPTQAPFIQVQITALTGGTDKSFTIGNGGTGQLLTVTRTWSQYDILQIDSENKTVKVNGVDVDFTGAFPEFTKGAGTLTLTNNLTTRTFNYYAYYYRRHV